MPFTPEQDRFILEAYFRSGEHNPKGEWSYSFSSCRQQFDAAYPDHVVSQYAFRKHVNRLADRFHITGSVCKGKPSGRRPKCNDKLIARLKRIRELDPSISIGNLATYAGVSYKTCHRIVAKFNEPKTRKIEIKTEIEPN